MKTVSLSRHTTTSSRTASLKVIRIFDKKRVHFLVNGWSEVFNVESDLDE